MSAEKALLNAYAEWRRLARATGRAIQLRNWKLVLECQAVIQQLQPNVTRLTRAARAEWKKSGADLAAREEKIHRVVRELMATVAANNSLLATARKTAESERKQLEQASQNLKRLQKSYVPGRPAAWTSVS